MESGRWQAVVRRRGLKAVFRTFSTKTDATKWARIMESEIERGVFVDRSEAERTTVGALIDRYRLEVTPLKKSARNEAQRLDQLRRHFGAFTLAAIRNTHIASYRDARLARLCHFPADFRSLPTASPCQHWILVWQQNVVP